MTSSNQASTFDGLNRIASPRTSRCSPAARGLPPTQTGLMPAAALSLMSRSMVARE